MDALHGSFLIAGVIMLVTAVLVAGLLWQRQPAARTSAQPEVLLEAPAVNRTI